MKRISYWVLSTITTVVLLFGYHTSTSGVLAASTSVQTPISGAASSGSSSSGSSSSGSNPPTDSTESSGTSAGSSAGAAAGTTSTSSTVTGDVAQTRWGPVQVELSLASGKITDVSVVQYPNENGRDIEINSYALPVLIQETLSAQSANIDMVSGATVTSDGYLTSLQSALDQANL
ncbi:MAG: FMN-binding protein [Propionibacteriales bacterium]|nr:FMN-binding protein [Propionibacteriales bacterium]